MSQGANDSMVLLLDQAEEIGSFAVANMVMAGLGGLVELLNWFDLPSQYCQCCSTEGAEKSEQEEAANPDTQPQSEQEEAANPAKKTGKKQNCIAELLPMIFAAVLTTGEFIVGGINFFLQHRRVGGQHQFLWKSGPGFGWIGVWTCLLYPSSWTWQGRWGSWCSVVPALPLHSPPYWYRPGGLHPSLFARTRMLRSLKKHCCGWCNGVKAPRTLAAVPVLDPRDENKAIAIAFAVPNPNGKGFDIAKPEDKDGLDSIVIPMPNGGPRQISIPLVNLGGGHRAIPVALPDPWWGFGDPEAPSRWPPCCPVGQCGLVSGSLDLGFGGLPGMPLPLLPLLTSTSNSLTINASVEVSQRCAKVQ